MPLTTNCYHPPLTTRHSPLPAVLQALRVETGAEIDLQKDSATGAATVAIRGSAEAMAAAKLAIERIIEAGP